MFFGQIIELSRGVGFQEILAFSSNKGVFGKLENRPGMILGRNIKCMRFRGWEAQILNAQEKLRSSSQRVAMFRFMVV
ncbi:hypothetical protein E2C01_023445 [Portunus trituberculatus]|uniref:Uncharacterized protein n=1 Tax=Portunus trituberculatus TaxID=210409 RepID=A0A5B7EA18_PORTR|nr:hypothetical protein [Portunus trituberculatus]